MTATRPFFSVCIPAYNRARYLKPLLDSILTQSFDDFEIVICEDKSPERQNIREIVEQYTGRGDAKIRYFENDVNLGYDANIRNLVEKSVGEFCFFMGNDDLMCANALDRVKNAIRAHKNIGMVLKSYAWFNESPDRLDQTVRYFSEERVFEAGVEAVSVCYRRSGVISGFIIHRDAAAEAATEAFDGTLYYQMMLTASVLATMRAVSVPDVLVLSRASEAPDFGNSEKEKGKFVPGQYTPEARLRMVGGAMEIIKYVDRKNKSNVAPLIQRDYANYFYPYIRDQLNLSPIRYWRLYRSFGRMGFSKFPMFHVYMILGYLLKSKNVDALTRLVRSRLGRSPQFGIR